MVADDTENGKRDTLAGSGSAKRSEGGKRLRWHSPVQLKAGSFPPTNTDVLSLQLHSDTM